VAAIYNRYEYLDERKAALEALGRKIETLIGRDTGNVSRSGPEGVELADRFNDRKLQLSPSA
jgi:hypothetical protein